MDAGSGLCIVTEKEGGREGLYKYVRVCKARVEMETVRVTRSETERKNELAAREKLKVDDKQQSKHLVWGFLFGRC